MIIGIDPDIKFEVPGPPRGKGRPRFTSRGGYGRAYTDKKTKEYEALIRQRLDEAFNLDQLTHGIPLVEPFELFVWAYMPIPKATNNENRAKMASGRIKPTKKPDIDNIIKVVMDALNGVVYADDNQIVGVQAVKLYSHDPRLVIALSHYIAGTEVRG